MTMDPYAALSRLPAGAFGSVTTPGVQQGEIYTYDTSQPTFNNDLLTGELAQFQSKYNWPEDLGDGRFAMTFQAPGGHKYDTLRAVYRLDPATGEYVMEGAPTPTRQVSSGEQIRDGFEQGVPIVGAGLAAGYGLSLLGGGAAAGGAASSGAAGGAAGGNALSAGLGGSAAGGAGSVAGSGLTFGSGAAGGLYTPTGFAAGSGSALAGSSLGASALGGTAAGTGAGMSAGWLGLSPNTWAQLGSTALGLYGQSQALGAMGNATDQSNALAQYVFDTNRADNKPLVDLRNSVLPQIQSLLSNPDSITQDPGYQFQLQEGMKARQNSAAGAGMTYSGAQQKALTRFGQDYAGTKLNDSLNRLTSVAGLGQVGSNNNQQAANQYGNTVGGNALNMGNARGSAYIGGANMAGNALGNWYNNRQYDQMWGLGG